MTIKEIKIPIGEGSKKLKDYQKGINNGKGREGN